MTACLFDIESSKGRVPLRHVFVPQNYAWRPIHSESAANSKSDGGSISFRFPGKKFSKISRVGVGYGEVYKIFLSKFIRTNAYSYAFRGADHEYNNPNSQQCYLFEWQSKQKWLPTQLFSILVSQLIRIRS